MKTVKYCYKDGQCWHLCEDGITLFNIAYKSGHDDDYEAFLSHKEHCVDDYEWRQQKQDESDLRESMI